MLVCAISRPRKRTVTLPLSPSARNFWPFFSFTRKSFSPMLGDMRISLISMTRWFFRASFPAWTARSGTCRSPLSCRPADWSQARSSRGRGPSRPAIFIAAAEDMMPSCSPPFRQ